MRFSMPQVVKFAAAALFLSLAGGSVYAQEWAKTRLEASPRHHEYVPLKHGDRTIQAFVVYPEVKSKAPVIVLIREIFGLSDWAKEMADALAAQGYIVVAPDLLSGYGPNGGGTSGYPGQDAVVKAVSGLNPDGVTADLDAAAAFVFYGPGPADVATITAPVYGFYAGNDARIGATVPATTDAMKAAGKKYEPVTYDGAGHGFMRAGEDPANSVPANKTARDEAFARLLKLLKGM